MNELQPFLDLISGKVPWLIPTLAFLMALRLPMKLLSGWLQRVLTSFVDRVAASPETDDEELLERLLGSLGYRFIAFWLDAIFSLKLPTSESLVKHRTDGGNATNGAVMGTVGLWLCLVALAVSAGCASFNAQVFNSEKLATDSAYSGVRAFNLYYHAATNGAPEQTVADLNAQRDRVYNASRIFSSSVSALDAARQTYATNATDATRLDVTALLTAVSGQSSNLTAIVNQALNPH
jgi:hypothetical protein